MLGDWSVAMLLDGMHFPYIYHGNFAVCHGDDTVTHMIVNVVLYVYMMCYMYIVLYMYIYMIVNVYCIKIVQKLNAVMTSGIIPILSSFYYMPCLFEVCSSVLLGKLSL